MIAFIILLFISLEFSKMKPNHSYSFYILKLRLNFDICDVAFL